MTKVILIAFVTICFALVVILPSVLNSRREGELIAFNRDATSGTREAFVEKVLGEDPDKFSPGKNVLEASNNESMIKSVAKNKYSTAYVSAGTIMDLKTGESKKEGVNITAFNNVMPTYDTVVDGTYTPQRNFNAFFRVENDSEESKILNWQTEDVTMLDDNLKASYAFYYWFEYSNEAGLLIEQGSEIANSDSRIDFTLSKEDKNFINYINTTELNSKDIRIEIVGSSSAQASMEELTEVADENLEKEFPDTNFEFVVATNGSGDAFSKKVPGTTGSDYIGMQSREPKESEYEEWGYTSDNYTKVYRAFAIDAIIIIYNNKHLDNKDIELTTNKNMMNILYTNNNRIQFDDVFTPIGGDE